MTDSQAALLAQFSNTAYHDPRFPVPTGWTSIHYDSATNGSFSAGVYQKTTAGHKEIVIAFRGSGLDLGDWFGANRALLDLSNDWDAQFNSALK